MSQTTNISEIGEAIFPHLNKPDVHKLSEAIREAFCEVYEQDVLTNWAMEMKQMLSDKNAKKFPHIPERGNLDLSLVKQSIFFCV